MTRPGQRIIIADDHPIFRRGLREVIEEHGGFDVVAEVADGAEAIRAIREHQPSVAVVDISMPGLDGMEVLVEGRALPDAPEFIVLTMHEGYAERAFELGALGYIVKEDAANELVACLEAVAAGQRYESSRARTGTTLGQEATNDLEVLTATERRVLKLVAEFKSSREIADILSVSFRTVQNHRAAMAKKLGLKGANALLQFATAHKDRL